MIAQNQRLDSFTRSYIEAALWSTTDQSDEQGGEPLDANYGPDDIDPETMAQMITDCTSFQERNTDLLSDSGLADKRAGHYFWLSRNGHGSGFFDEDLDALQDAARAYGSFDLYVGDDGVIYGSPLDTRGGGVNEARPRRGRRTSDQKAEWMRIFQDEAVKWFGVHPGQIKWQDAESLYSQGWEPKAAARKLYGPSLGEARPRPAPGRQDRAFRRHEPTGPSSGPIRREPTRRGPPLLPPAPSGDSTRSAHRPPQRSPSARRRAR